MHRCVCCGRESEDVHLFRSTHSIIPLCFGCATRVPVLGRDDRELRVRCVATERLYPQARLEVARQFARMNQ